MSFLEHISSRLSSMTDDDAEIIRRQLDNGGSTWGQEIRGPAEVSARAEWDSVLDGADFGFARGCNRGRQRGRASIGIDPIYEWCEPVSAAWFRRCMNEGHWPQQR